MRGTNLHLVPEPPPGIDLGTLDVRGLAEAALPARLARAQRDTELAAARLGDRGIDPTPIIGTDAFGKDVSVASFHVILRRIAVTEKAGQAPTFAGSRLVLQTDLDRRHQDLLFSALNQQSAEEAVHGDKVFGAAYYEMGGAAAQPYDDEGFGAGSAAIPSESRSENTSRLCDMMAVLGGVETLAMQNAFPFVVECATRWGHAVGQRLAAGIRDVVRPEEARHILTWRYVFREVAAPRGPEAVNRYFNLTNLGRDLFVADRMTRTEFDRLMSAPTPTSEQLLGRPVPASSD